MRAREAILATGDLLLLHKPLAAFLDRDDSHIPRKLTEDSVQNLVNCDFDRLCHTPYFGATKLDRFLTVLERIAGRTSTSRPGPADDSRPAVPTTSPDVSTSPLSWNDCCDIINRASIDHRPLGRFAASLDDLPRNLWSMQLHELTSRSLSEVEQLPGLGPARLTVITEIVKSVAAAIRGFPNCPHLRPGGICATHIHQAEVWVERVVQERCVPTAAELRSSFLGPLFQQLAIDLGDDLASLVRRRIGVDRSPETLDAIAADRGLTRERIRQLTGRASDVLAIRWPEGKHLLDDFFELLLSSPSSAEQVDIVKTALDQLFELSEVCGVSRPDVLELWERAGRNHCTPMAANELATWCGVNVPTLAPNQVIEWISHEVPTCTTTDGSTVYFSRDPDDLLLHRILTTKEPISVFDLSDFTDGEERNIRNRLDRDPRFIEDEYKRIHASDLLSVHRNGDSWHVQLLPTDGHACPASETISIGCLTMLIVGGLTHAGIVDATVWGTFRFANDLLRQLYGARLPDHITPFIFASLLVRHSDGAVRHMRRRRLRWDVANTSVPVRGKYGWIDKVVADANTPLTMDELDAALRQRYQDYERYVLGQLTVDADEDGGGLAETRVLQGRSTRIPAIFVSRRWRLNSSADNVSEGIRLFGARVIAATGKQRLARQELSDLPWMIEWCERHAYGQMRWTDETPADSAVVDFSDDDSPAVEESDSPHPDVTPLVNSPVNGSSMKGSESSELEIAGILSRFL